MNAILAALPLLQSALNVFGAFKGSAVQAKADNAVQDAMAVIAAVSPLLQSFSAGQEVTPDQVKAALAGKNAALAAFDAEIARQDTGP